MESTYEKIQQIGSGATAEVYLVRDTVSGLTYAMKVCEQAHLAGLEGEILGKLEHGAFPTLREYREGYVVMEYVEGNTLQEILDRGRTFGLKEIVHIMEAVLKAMQYLHLQENPIIYRDLKPANIMIEKNGRIRIIDLGAAYVKGCFLKEQEAAVMAGTYGYGAPEQFWKGVVPDIRCDIYAAGKVLAYLLSGKNPAIPPYNMEQFCKGLNRVPVPFQRILERSLATNPLARFEDCESMRREIWNAYEEATRKRVFKLHKKTDHNYIKCIWLSEYRRIF